MDWLKKYLTPLLLALCLTIVVVGVSQEYGNTVMSWFGQTVNEPITLAVVIEETKLVTPARDAMFGKTANALRKEKKWRQFDTDQVPKDLQVLKEAADKNQPSKYKYQPWLFILHSTTVTWNGPMPESDAKLSELITQQGGM